MVQEIQYRVNKLLYDEQVTVTTTPQKLKDLATIPESVGDEIKTVIITVLGSNNIYYGLTASASTSSGGVIGRGTKEEMPLMDLNLSPYFVASASTTVALAFWG